MRDAWIHILPCRAFKPACAAWIRRLGSNDGVQGFTLASRGGEAGPWTTVNYVISTTLLHHKVTTCFDHGQDTKPVLFSTWRQSWVANLAVKLHLMREIHGTQSLKNNDVYLETFEAQLAELGRERAAVDVDVGPERRRPRYHETCLALESIKCLVALVTRP